jgi:drug/metabolite transporter (DMT)-like permease
MVNHIGELAAAGTAVSWTAGAMIFEAATRRAGVMAINLLKVAFGSLYLVIFAWCASGSPFPLGLSLHTWIWMSGSGFLGFVIGDYYLFNTYRLIGSRLGMLLMSASVPLTALASYFLFAEALGSYALVGMIASMGGLFLTVQSGSRAKAQGSAQNRALHPSPQEYRKGVLFGLMSALAMAGGTLLTKVGALGVEPIAATQVRVFAALFGFFIVSLFNKQMIQIVATVTDRKSMTLIALGSVFGPFIGVGCLLFALQHAQAGVVATITALIPILIIPPSVLIFKRQVQILEVVGACIAVAGVALLFV